MSGRWVVVVASLLAGCASRGSIVKPAVAVDPAAREDLKTPRFPVPTTRELGEPAGVTARAASASVERLYTIEPSARAPSLGGDDAKVVLEVCADFVAPACAAFVPTLHELNESYGELVRIVWRDCPDPARPSALLAAEAAREVYEQRGDAAFWAYHDQLFAHYEQLEPALLVQLAGTLDGIDPERVREALRDHRHVPTVQAELTALRDAGATRDGLVTPTSFVNGRMLIGAQSPMAFEDAIERALQEPPEARREAEAQSQLAYPMARVRHLLVQYTGARAAPSSLSRTREAARSRIEALSLRAATGESFESLVRHESECPSAREGGVVGRYTRGELPSALDIALFSLAPGTISEPVETEFGFHLLRREP